MSDSEDSEGGVLAPPPKRVKQFTFESDAQKLKKVGRPSSSRLSLETQTGS